MHKKIAITIKVEQKWMHIPQQWEKEGGFQASAAQSSTKNIISLQIQKKVGMINMPFEDMNSGPLLKTCGNIKIEN